MEVHDPNAALTEEYGNTLISAMHRLSSAGTQPVLVSVLRSEWTALAPSNHNTAWNFLDACKWAWSPPRQFVTLMDATGKPANLNNADPSYLDACTVRLTGNGIDAVRGSAPPETGSSADEVGAIRDELEIVRIGADGRESETLLHVGPEGQSVATAPVPAPTEASVQRRRAFLASFKHVALIGQGYFATVKHYKNEESGDNVAVKELKTSSLANDDHRKRFSTEVELIQRLKGHPNIVDIIDSTVSEEYAAYIMPKAEMHLEEYMRHRPQLSDAIRVSIFRQIAKAIQFAHSNSVLHRDLAPRNVLVVDTAAPAVVVADFGLGKNADEIVSLTHSSLGGYGVVYFTSPEQQNKLKHASERSDIYALGKMLTYLMTGKLPDKNYACSFSLMIGKATSDDPSDRHENVDAFIEDFESTVALMSSPELLVLNIGPREAIKRHATEPNWTLVHTAFVKQNLDDRPYGHYVEPIVEFLSAGNNLHDYFDSAQADFTRFVREFVSSVFKLLSTTRWPFAAATDFGNLLHQMLLLPMPSEDKLECFRALWNTAHVFHQGATKKNVEQIFRNEELPQDILVPAAVHIADSKAAVRLIDFDGIDLPDPIRRAIAMLEVK